MLASVKALTNNERSWFVTKWRAQFFVKENKTVQDGRCRNVLVGKQYEREPRQDVDIAAVGMIGIFVEHDSTNFWQNVSWSIMVESQCETNLWAGGTVLFLYASKWCLKEANQDDEGIIVWADLADEKFEVSLINQLLPCEKHIIRPMKGKNTTLSILRNRQTEAKMMMARHAV